MKRQAQGWETSGRRMTLPRSQECFPIETQAPEPVSASQEGAEPTSLCILSTWLYLAHRRPPEIGNIAHSGVMQPEAS